MPDPKNRLSLSKRMLKKGIFIFLFLLVGRFIQFVKELFVANEIGVSEELYAFIMAQLVIGVFVDFLFVPFSYALIPIFIQLRQASRKKANLLFTKVLFFSILLGLFCLYLIHANADFFLTFLARKFSPDAQKLLLLG